MFLNETQTIRVAEDWNDPGVPKLWLYNLHYFDDLNAQGAEQRVSWHQDLISRWVDENPPGTGNGWEPYPTSLRIVNWVKWALAGNEIDQKALHSLAVQARWLRCHLEYHLLGNHLLANAKALVFVGAYFSGNEAEAWFRKGYSLFLKQLRTQVLTDGGHCERSTMYHLTVLEDVLDVINILSAYGFKIPSKLLDKAKKMLAWSQVMRHPDHQIPFFNDAAFDNAPTPKVLDSHANRLGITCPEGHHESVHLAASGYVRIKKNDFTAFLDVAPLADDHLTAHGHADTFTFELSVGDRRLVSNTGTSTYQPGLLRTIQRSTASHNTVVLNKVNSSEIWDAFRVGRRAKPSLEEIKLNEKKEIVIATHDGYSWLPGSPVHQREWRVSRTNFTVEDTVYGSEWVDFQSYLHFGPGLIPFLTEYNAIIICDSISDQTVAHIFLSGDVSVRVKQSFWYPRFGEREKNFRVVLDTGRAKPPIHVGYRIVPALG